MTRYYWTRLRAGPKSGTYRIMDRVLDIWVAECSFKENAELVSGALNLQVSQQQAKVNEQPNSSISVSKSDLNCPIQPTARSFDTIK